VRRDLGDRLRLVVFGRRERTRTEQYNYLGTNLGNTLTSDEYHAGAELQLALSVKTRLVSGGDQGWHLFPNLPARDGISTLAYGGLRTDGSALIAGYALAGMRWFGLDSGESRDVVYADVSATWRVTPKTKLGGHYRRDADYSSLAMSGPTPTNLGEQVEVFIERFLSRTIYLRASGRQTRLVSDGAVLLVPLGRDAELSMRNDRIREVGGELGYQFRSRIRLAITATYRDTVSTIETFGVEGLLAGFTLQYNPPQPTFR
jgi:hypothetical protein